MSKNILVINEEKLSYEQFARFVFSRETFTGIAIAPETEKRIRDSQTRFQSLLTRGLPIYGVTTGFGDSCHQSLASDQSEELQSNLVSYLLCGTGAILPVGASRATFLIRMKSLSRGYSGVSFELIDRMRVYLEHDWIPVCPREGSLGASGDLIPLAYLANILRGEGQVHVGGEVRDIATVLKENKMEPYRLKAKEGLAIVNGTSTMAGLYLYNLSSAKFLADLVCLSTGWLCLALKGRTEAFGSLVNEQAKFHPGQTRAAKMIRSVLMSESYVSTPIDKIKIENFKTTEFVQDRYSLRCTPQVMGPIYETLTMAETWFENEANSTADNPLIGDEGELEMGGNFYGGHLAFGMDYLKVCLGNMADLIDRQLMTVIDEKSNRGLPSNLIDIHSIPAEKKHLHHGLKGLHQAVSAITSEILARTISNSIFSRSSESHNQDKVSLGMSAAVQCQQIIDPLYTIQSMYLICLAQALDLRGISLKGHDSQAMYKLVRKVVPRVSMDQPLGEQINRLASELRLLADGQKKVFA